MAVEIGFASTSKLTVAMLVAPPATVSVTVAGPTKPILGVPEMVPVAALMATPAGSPAAVKTAPAWGMLAGLV